MFQNKVPASLLIMSLRSAPSVFIGNSSKVAPSSTIGGVGGRNRENADDARSGVYDWIQCSVLVLDAR